MLKYLANLRFGSLPTINIKVPSRRFFVYSKDGTCLSHYWDSFDLEITPSAQSTKHSTSILDPLKILPQRNIEL